MIFLWQHLTQTAGTPCCVSSAAQARQTTGKRGTAIAIAMCVGCADCATFTGLPVLHRLAERAKVDNSKVVTYNNERFLPLCRDCDAHETLMSLVVDLTDRVAQLDNDYLQTIEDRARRWNSLQEDEPTPEAWREPNTMANRRRLMALDELTAELIKDRIKKRRQAAESGGTMMPGWKQYGVKMSKEDAPPSGSGSTNQQQKRKLDILEPMTKTTEDCNDAAQSKPRPATPVASQVLYKAPPMQRASSTAGFIVVQDEQQHGVEQQQEQQQEEVGEAEGAAQNDSGAAQVEAQPSPATTLSANL